MAKPEDPHDTIKRLRSELAVAQSDLERMRNAAPDSRLTALADALFSIPDVWQCIISPAEVTWNTRNKASGESSGSQFQVNTRETKFRCFLVSTSGKMCDSTCKSLKEAIQTSFDACRVKIPNNIPL